MRVGAVSVAPSSVEQCRKSKISSVRELMRGFLSTASLCLLITHAHTRMNAHIHSVLKLSKSIHFFAYTSCLTLACLYLHIISSFDVKGNAGFTCAAYVYLCACVPPFMYVHL